MTVFIIIVKMVYRHFLHSSNILTAIVMIFIRYQAVLHLTEERGRQDHGLTLDSGIYVSRFESSLSSIGVPRLTK